MTSTGLTFLQDYQDAMAVHTVSEARVWMAERVREFMGRWQHEAMGYDEARSLICINLAYAAGMQDEKAQRRVYQLYGAIHPMVAIMTKEEKKGRQFIFEFSRAELETAAARWRVQALGEERSANVYAQEGARS